ncbi:MAG: tryptophan synthase subunit alpha [Planctomycetota bacterium]
MGLMQANRIDTIFSDLRSSGGKALMPFLTAGDPDVATTIRMLEAAQEAGASICEIGIPFSDPIADGPVIQASMSRALDQGLKVDEIFAAVAEARPRLTIGLVAMVSYSIVHRLGLNEFIGRAKEAGFDGFIFPDLPLAESGPARAAAAEAGLILSMLIAPTTPIERAEQIAAASTGFVYVVSRPGITGARASLPPELPDRLERLRGVTDLPMAVGFGISSAEQVREVVSVADAAIVGSALVAHIHEFAQESADAAVTGARKTIAELTEGLTTKAP